jgi:hypothetical protein
MTSNFMVQTLLNPESQLLFTFENFIERIREHEEVDIHETQENGTENFSVKAENIQDAKRGCHDEDDHHWNEKGMITLKDYVEKIISKLSYQISYGFCSLNQTPGTEGEAE